MCQDLLICSWYFLCIEVVEMPSTTTATPAISTENIIPMTSVTDGSRDSTTTDESVSGPMSAPDGKYPEQMRVCTFVVSP